MEFRAKFNEVLELQNKAYEAEDWETYDRVSETLAKMQAKMDQEIRETSIPTCKVCKKTPEEITEYKFTGTGLTPTEFVREHERFIPGTNKFYCTTCYIKAGMPLF